MGHRPYYDEEYKPLRPRERRAKEELDRTRYTRELKHEDVRFEEGRARQERYEYEQGRRHVKEDLDDLRKKQGSLKYEYDKETNPGRKEHLRQEIDINEEQIKDIHSQRHEARMQRFKSVVSIGGEGRGTRTGISNRINRLSNAYHSVKSDPFENVNVNNLGIDGIGSRAFDFKMPRMDINEGFNSNFDNMFFGRKAGNVKGYRRMRYKRRKYSKKPRFKKRW